MSHNNKLLQPVPLADVGASAVLVNASNVGRYCKSEYDCIDEAIDFGAYERGVSDAARAFDRNLLRPAQPVQPATAMNAAAINHAHSLAIELETLLYWVGKSSPNQDSAVQVLENYRKEMRAAHESSSPTFMGEPAISKVAQPVPLAIKQGGEA